MGYSKREQGRMKSKDIVFKRITYLKGPNIWTYRPVIEAWVDIGAFEELPSNLLPGFNERLTAWLPGLIVHRCGIGEPGGFLLRLADGTWMAHILEHVAIELQNLAGSKVGFGQTRGVAQVEGLYKMAVRTRSEIVGRAAIEAGRELLLAAVNDQPFAIDDVVSRLTDLVDRHCLGPSTGCIVDAVVDRRIPWLTLNGGNLIQLGYGVRQRRIWTAETDRTSAIAESIASDKDMTKSLLAAVGVPVPEGRIVDSPEDAWDAAESIGLPVAVKPVDGNHGRGISLELSTREDVTAAFHLADAEGSDVMVERFVRGNEHRLLVVGGKVIAAARGEAAYVVGDGVQTVQQLIEAQINSDPRRGLTEDFPLNHIVLGDDPVVLRDLERQGVTATSVPAAGQRVLIQRNGNVAFNCTDEVHPEVASMVALAARVIGLDISGIDLVAEDISRPLAEQGGAIVEVNAGPGLLSHLRPADGPPPPVGPSIAEYLFPQDERDDSGRIPIVGISGSSNGGTSEIARLLSWLLRVSGKKVGLASADGLFLDRRQIDKNPGTRFDTAQCLLMNRVIDAAVFETPAEMILREGLPYDRCRVGVVTDVTGGDQLAEFYIEDDDQLAKVVRTQIDVVLGDGVAVLNAADARAAAMAGLCDGEVIFYATEKTVPAIVAHCAVAKNRAVYCVGEQVMLATGCDEEVLDTLDTLSVGGNKLPAELVVAATAAAWACGLTVELIRAGIKTFAADRLALAH
jgi:cyanophycin synthetase